MILRPYQAEAIDSINEQFEQYSSTLIVMATGLGKTIVFSEVAKDMLAHGRVMVLAHRWELIRQAYEKLYAITGVEPDIEMADNHVQEQGVWKSKIIVGSIQTQIAGMAGRGRMTKFDPDEFSLLILDEAHHVPAKSYRKVVKYYKQNPHLKILGCTATPDRADEKALGRIFESVAYDYDIKEGVTNGWLVPISQLALYLEGLDLSGVRTTAGDLNGADLARVLEYEKPLHGIADGVLQYTGDKKTLIFAASVAHAERIAEIINRPQNKPDSARFVCGTTPKQQRDEIFEDYTNKRFQYLVNVGITTEGFDEPTIEIVVMARPTKSRSLYAQMAGRGTRTLPGVVDYMTTKEERQAAIALSDKPNLEIIDFVGNAGRHKLITSADILGGDYNDEVVERAKKNAEKKDAPADILTELQLAEQQIIKERRIEQERKVREKVILRATYSTAKINPFDVLDLAPKRERAWNKGREPTEKQLAFLERNGVDTSGLNFTHASQLIDRIINRHKNKQCSYKQARLLRRYGYEPSKIEFDQARELIDKIKANGWKKPA